MKPEDELLALKLKQARRTERPHNLHKFVFIVCLLFTLCGLLGNCTADGARSQTPAEKKANTDAIWAGDADAHKRRMP